MNVDLLHGQLVMQRYLPLDSSVVNRGDIRLQGRPFQNESVTEQAVKDCLCFTDEAPKSFSESVMHHNATRTGRVTKYVCRRLVLVSRGRLDKHAVTLHSVIWKRSPAGTEHTAAWWLVPAREWRLSWETLALCSEFVSQTNISKELQSFVCLQNIWSW